MPTLKYWVAECLHDSTCYSIVGKTRREVLEILKTTHLAERYGKPERRQIEYWDALDLFDQCTGEGGGRMMGRPCK